MKGTRILHDLGQSIWLDNITRDLLKTGMLRRYIDEFSITGLTSNPTIFDHAIKNSDPARAQGRQETGPARRLDPYAQKAGACTASGAAAQVLSFAAPMMRNGAALARSGCEGAVHVTVAIAWTPCGRWPAAIRSHPRRLRARAVRHRSSLAATF